MALTNETAEVVSTKQPRALRKQEIVELATRLFAERGYQGTSMGDLAEGVGLRKASLFHHFESKDCLYNEVVEKVLATVNANMADSVSTTTTNEAFVARLEETTSALIKVFASQPCAARLLLREAMDWGPVMRSDLSNRVRETWTRTIDFIRAGQQAGAFNNDTDAEQLVLSMVGMHFLPFVIDRTIADIMGKSAFTDLFMAERQRAMNEQIHRLVVRP